VIAVGDVSLCLQCHYVSANARTRWQTFGNWDLRRDAGLPSISKVIMKTMSLATALLLVILLTSLSFGAELVGGQAAIEIRLQPNQDATTTIRFRGSEGIAYRIESSDNLESWTALAEGITAEAEWTEWKDTRSPAMAQRFYRVTSASGATRTAMRAVDPNTDSERLLTALAGRI
jgi:hypothetical protein